jgi:hypothetical protein
MFGDGQIVISTKCSGLIKQIQDASRQPETNKINKLVGWDLIDAFRYGICAFDNENLIEKHAPSSSVYVFSL